MSLLCILLLCHFCHATFDVILLWLSCVLIAALLWLLWWLRYFVTVSSLCSFSWSRVSYRVSHTRVVNACRKTCVLTELQPLTLYHTTEPLTQSNMGNNWNGFFYKTLPLRVVVRAPFLQYEVSRELGWIIMYFHIEDGHVRNCLVYLSFAPPHILS